MGSAFLRSGAEINLFLKAAAASSSHESLSAPPLAFKGMRGGVIQTVNKVVKMNKPQKKTFVVPLLFSVLASHAPCPLLVVSFYSLGTINRAQEENNCLMEQALHLHKASFPRGIVIHL